MKRNAYFVAPTQRPNAGGKLFNVFKMTHGKAVELDMTPSHNQAVVQAEADKLNKRAVKAML